MTSHWTQIRERNVQIKSCDSQPKYIGCRGHITGCGPDYVWVKLDDYGNCWFYENELLYL